MYKDLIVTLGRTGEIMLMSDYLKRCNMEYVILNVLYGEVGYLFELPYWGA